MTDRYKRLAAPVSAVLLVGCTVAALSLATTPDTKDSPARVIEWYQHHHDAAIAQTFLLAYAGLAAMVFFTCVALYLRSRGSQLMSTVTIVGAGVTAAGFLLGAGLNATLVDRTSHIAPAAAQALNYLQDDGFAPMLFGGFFVAVLSMGIAMLRTKAVPKALGIITVIVGVAAGTGIASWFAFMATGPLALVIAGYVYARSGRPQEISLPDVPAQRDAVEIAEAERAQA